MLDEVAPEVTKVVPLRRRQPWYNNVIKNEKILQRKLERIWRCSRQKSDFVAFAVDYMGIAAGFEVVHVAPGAYGFLFLWQKLYS